MSIATNIIIVVTGNSWGYESGSDFGCVGCGNQEQFYACADIAIENNIQVVTQPPKDTVIDTRTHSILEPTHPPTIPSNTNDVIIENDKRPMHNDKGDRILNTYNISRSHIAARHWSIVHMVCILHYVLITT